MIDLVIGFALGIVFAGAFGYTSDRSIRSGQPFSVDHELYQCRRVDVQVAQ